ncbi:Protein involved in initiation of plasmid replication [Spirosoma endophyticum]|uniref:Protein involved in initiation of plasmid replication n=2 Tax=Spirosoma endophyticum TaxID=662367 RepID=A0A1I2FCW6_9BACT|nr:Protein involved in initiation of plasmid replication [Spirosoma endophyticum]
MTKETTLRRRSDIGERTIARMKAGRNGIVEATYRMDVVEFRVFFTMLTMISPDDVTFCEYELRVADIIRLFSLSRDGRSYESIKDAAERLVNKTMVIYHTKEDGNRYRTVIPFLTSASSQVGNTKSESIRVTFHPELKPYLLQLRSEYLEFDVRNLSGVHSQFSIRLYMMLRHQMNLKKTSIRYTVERLRDVFEIGEKEYPLYGNFKQKVLLRACNDLNASTNIRINQMIEERSNRKVAAVIFHMSSQALPLLQTDSQSKKIANERAESTLSANNEQQSTPLASALATEYVVDQLHSSIANYVGRETVKNWLQKSPVDQVRNAIHYTLKQLKQGSVIKNVGGYIQKMINTHLPAVPDNKNPTVDTTIQIAKLKADEQQATEAKLKALTETKHKIAFQLLKDHPEWHEPVQQHMQSGLFGRFYDKTLSLFDNVRSPVMYGPFFQSIERLSPLVFNDIEKDEE